MPKKLKKICAWCHPKEKGENITHGICKDCKGKMESKSWRWNPIRLKFEKTSVGKLAELAGKSKTY